ncbi:MAG: flagellar type III secretion system pore protein FliP [Hyphomicrobiales bacterium]|nr:flagellar type III secretion system pore protein FliP [Rhodoblastus sp.]MCC0000247.1 flagellar type III secretion system pore protein FliP [Methylobacteriaceae bacterium]MCC2103115.1 flagellar type III secretion system pore protein FliP [Hyphomicrobiales bacterium]MCC2106440.1 flagellar type III secretion system pore protein FliP [Hyphomicrobiales bacterium]MCO5086080.1 flagellar type III secretion system pore protein FliP [Methylobacteriaceae bacterium]
MKRTAGSTVLIWTTVSLANVGAASAQVSDLLSGQANGEMSGRIVQLVAVLSVLSIAPSLLVMATSFTRFVIALSFLRSGLGLQSTPGNIVLISLSLFLTIFVMSPTFDKAWRDGVQPLVDRKIDEREAVERMVGPFRDFMLSNVRESDLRLMKELQVAKTHQTPERNERTVALTVLVPAFMISELRRGFEIGFLVALPFLVIDLIVATIVMSMGMMMLPPSVIGLPIKVLFFVLIDGWSLLVRGLVRSYG